MSRPPPSALCSGNCGGDCPERRGVSSDCGFLRSPRTRTRLGACLPGAVTTTGVPRVWNITQGRPNTSRAAAIDSLRTLAGAEDRLPAARLYESSGCGVGSWVEQARLAGSRFLAHLADHGRRRHQTTSIALAAPRFPRHCLDYGVLESQIESTVAQWCKQACWFSAQG